MEIIKLNNIFSRESVSSDPDYIYLFTDNLMRTSGSNLILPPSTYIDDWSGTEFASSELYYPNSSQAVIRGLDNAYPITTMVNPYKTQLNNDWIPTMDKIWDQEVNNILRDIHKFKGIKYYGQFGNGRFSYMIKFPELFKLLNKKLLRLGIINDESTSE